MVQTTTIYRTGISNNVIANDFYKQKLNQKFNEKFNSANQVKFPLQLLFVELGVGMSPHRICENFQQKKLKFPQKSLFKITDISSFKFDGARPSWFKIEMQ